MPRQRTKQAKKDGKAKRKRRRKTLRSLAPPTENQRHPSEVHKELQLGREFLRDYEDTFRALAK